jgi:hypothetical protein
MTLSIEAVGGSNQAQWGVTVYEDMSNLAMKSL